MRGPGPRLAILGAMIRTLVPDNTKAIIKDADVSIQRWWQRSSTMCKLAVSSSTRRAFARRRTSRARKVRSLFVRESWFRWRDLL